MIGRPFQPGDIIAPGYEVIEHLSRGRRLDVYDAWSGERGTRCVIKALRPERASEQKAQAQLAREGELLQTLSHPHLVRGYETRMTPTPLIVMETLGGQTLAHMIEEEKRELEPPELAHLALQLGSAVRYLHRSGFLHLDLKPSNIVADGGFAKLIDLSLARPPGPAPAGIGTWCYLAPEQATGGNLGPAADVWGLGVVLFEAATGTPAFDDPDESDGDEPSDTEGEEVTTDGPATWESDDPADAGYPRLRESAPPVRSVRELEPALAHQIDACLSPDPADRPALEELLAGLEVAARLPPSERQWAPAPAPSASAESAA
ncbi:MAG TPA: serine/threonine-protein kinase [Solirubrobacterales bacterium]|jgi:eukaryotic-like serine/threonine-protein kinase|nr:serine/threonine-protein kinase [Solirubrobacterales bacterium]